MKRRALVFIIYLGLIIILFGSFILTAVTQNIIFIYLIFGIFFLLGIISTVIYLKNFVREYNRQEDIDKDDVIEEINEKKGYNQLEYDVHQVKAVVDTWKQSSKGDIVKGIVFVSIFIGCIVGFVIFISLGKEYTVWGFVCFGAGALEIIGSLVVVKFLERRSLKYKKGRNYRKATALVLGCTLSSQSSTGERHKHIRNTTYKVFLELNNERVTTYSKEYYEIGEKVDVNIDEKNPKIVLILNKHEDIFDLDEEEY